MSNVGIYPPREQKEKTIRLNLNDLNVLPVFKQKNKTSLHHLNMLSVASRKQFWNSQKLCMNESAFIITVSGWRQCYKTACPHPHSPFYFSSTLQSESSPLSAFSSPALAAALRGLQQSC